MKRYILLSIISVFTLSFEMTEKNEPFELSTNILSFEEIDAKALYTTTCKACHGKKGSSKFAGVKPLTKSTLALKQTIEIIKNGKQDTAMIGYKSVYSPKEIEAIAKYVMRFQEDKTK
jgi:mono/diheme cytochrome c family protein